MEGLHREDLAGRHLPDRRCVRRFHQAGPGTREAGCGRAGLAGEVGRKAMISRRGLEISTAALTGIFGVVVVVSSIDNGIGWSSAAVDAGTFPFLTGIIIVLGSLYTMGQARSAAAPSPLSGW